MTGAQDLSSLADQVYTQFGEKACLPLIKELRQDRSVSEGFLKDLLTLLIKREGAFRLAEKLKETFSPDKVVNESDKQRTWELLGLIYYNAPRLYEAVVVFSALYDHILQYQQDRENWAHKGMPLVYVSDCYKWMGCPVLAKRYFMLALCEDAIRGKGNISPQETGIYFRAVRWYGLTDLEVSKYAQKIHDLKLKDRVNSLFPEWILLELDKDWMVEYPTPLEAGMYLANTRFIQHLLSKLGDSRGKRLEQLAEYVLLCMPGCRTLRRVKSPSTDYDIVCSVEGVEADFRSELGRYFLCECKDWDTPAGFSAIAKFCRVLDSTKSRFGILFSKSGISGHGETKNAEREQLKVFQDRGMVIVIVDETDLKQVAEGINFTKMLRAKYESIRLDIQKKA